MSVILSNSIKSYLGTVDTRDNCILNLYLMKLILFIKKLDVLK